MDSTSQSEIDRDIPGSHSPLKSFGPRTGSGADNTRMEDGSMRILTVLALAAMLVVCIQPAQAEGLSFYGGLGFAKMLEDGAPGGSLGITAGAMLALAGAEGLSIGAETGYLMLGNTDIGMFKISQSIIPFTGQVWYDLAPEDSMSPMLTGGIGLYNVRAKVEAFGISASDSETKFGFNFGGGLKFGDPDASMRFGFDARFHLVMLGSDDDEFEDDSNSSSTAKLLTVMARVFF